MSYAAILEHSMPLFNDQKHFDSFNPTAYFRQMLFPLSKENNSKTVIFRYLQLDILKIKFMTRTNIAFFS